jgi:ribosome-binding protein aMBF1 (putative translation factor)
MTDQMSKAENYESDILNEIYDEISPSELKKVEKRMLLAQKISDGIKANGWEKSDFAKALNKPPAEITKWISGTYNFNIDTLFDIEEILGIELITA